MSTRLARTPTPPDSIAARRNVDVGVASHGLH